MEGTPSLVQPCGTWFRDDDQTGAWCHGRRGYRASMREVLPGVFHWTTLHPRIQRDVSSYWLDRAGVAIDPLVPSELGLEWFSERTSSPKAVLLSNRHHYRDSARFVDAFGCSVHCNAAGLHEFSHGDAVEGFEPGDTLPGGVLACEVAGICPTKRRSTSPNSVPSPSPTASSAVDGEAHPASFPTA